MMPGPHTVPPVVTRRPEMDATTGRHRLGAKRTLAQKVRAGVDS